MQRIHGCNGLNNQFDPPTRFSSTAMARGSPPWPAHPPCQRTLWRGTERTEVGRPCGTPLNIKHPVPPKPDEHLRNTACYTAYDPRKNGWLGTLDQLNSQQVHNHTALTRTRCSYPLTALSFTSCSRHHLYLSHTYIQAVRILIAFSHTCCSYPHTFLSPHIHTRYSHPHCYL